MKGHRLLPLLHLAVALLFFRGAAFHDRFEMPCNPNRWSPWSAHVTAEEAAPPAVNTDCALAYYPRRVFATESIRGGDLPLWDPYSFTGQPFLANFQSALLYPVNLPLYLLDPKSAMGWFLIIHIALAGWFASLLARKLGLSPGAATAAGVVFQLNSFFLSRAGHPTFVASGVWAPLALCAAIDVVRKPSGRSAAHLAVALAMAALAGFPQTAIHIYYMVAWFFAAALLARYGRARSGAFLLAAAGSILLSFALGAFQFLPTAEFLKLSTRAPIDFPTFLSGTHHPAMLLRMLVPDFFGNPFQGNLWSTLLSTGNGYFRQNYVSTINYMGVLPLVIGVYGVFTGRKKLFFAALLLLPLLVIWGTPPAQAAWHLPGFRFSRVDRLIVLPFLALSIGFGAGVDRIVRAGRVPPGVTAGIAAALAAAAAIGVFRDAIAGAISSGRIPPGYAASTVNASVFTTVAVAAAALALIAFRPKVRGPVFIAAMTLFAGADLFLFGSRFHLDLPKNSTFFRTPEIAMVSDRLGRYGRIARFAGDGGELLPPGTASLYGIQDVAGINALNLERYHRLMESVEPGLYQRRRYGPFRRKETLASPLLDLLGARVFTVDRSGRVLFLPGGHDPLPRASFHYRWESAGDEETLRRVTSPYFRPAEQLFLAGDAGPPPLREGSGSADILEYRPDRVSVEVSTDSSGVLLLTDAWYPGWEATVDGEKATVLRADYAFRAVAVPRGHHVVEFAFRPASFRVGRAISAVTALLTLALIFSSHGRGRKR